jgi:tRNA pseudouridine13 synthase
LIEHKEAMNHTTQPIDEVLIRATRPGAAGLQPVIRARYRSQAADFRVHELPAYEADGVADGHLLLRMRLVDCNTDWAIREVAGQLGIDAREIGCAGLKDRHAITEQTISLPASCLSALGAFQHEGIELGVAEPHSHKLRRGHLKGNAFSLTLRDVECPDKEAFAARFNQIAEAGIANVFGSQRFGYQGDNVRRGIARLAQPKRLRPGDLMLSALQSALFNLQLTLRREDGLEHKVRQGDWLKRRDTGGLFCCEDEAAEQARLDAGEVDVTATLPGSKTRSLAGSYAHALEERALRDFGLERDSFSRLGKKAPGSHRPLRVLPMQPKHEWLDEDSLLLAFELPAGSYATRLLEELVVELVDASRKGSSE